MKKILCVIFAFVLVFALSVNAFADFYSSDGSGFGMVKPIQKKPKTKEITKTVDICDLDILEDTNEPDFYGDVQIGDWEDVEGNVWGNAIKFWVVKRENLVNKESIVFDLNKDFDDFYGVVAFSPDSDKGAKMCIRVYLDGDLEYESDYVTRNSEAIEFCVPVYGCSKLMIECYTNSSNFGYCIVDGCVTK